MRKLSIAVATVSIVAGVGLIFGGTYGSNFVKDNLAEQKIVFSSAEALEAQGRSDLVQYADQTVDSGKEAKAFASYIQGHLAKVADGQTYSVVSGQYQKLEDKTTAEAQKLAAQRESLFMGEMLRGTLLNAYGWGIVSSVAFVAGFALTVLGVLIFALSAANNSKVVSKPAKKTAVRTKKSPAKKSRK